MSIQSLTKDADLFLATILAEAQGKGFVTQDWFIDHLCFRTESEKDYQETCYHFSNFGNLLVESPVNGRLISSFKLATPWKLKTHEIGVIEVPSPKPGKPYVRGFEHIEVVIAETLEDFILKHSSLNFNTDNLSRFPFPEIEIKLKSGVIKFHRISLEEIITWELGHSNS